MYFVWSLELAFIKICKCDPVRNGSIPLGRRAETCYSCCLPVLASPTMQPPRCCYFRASSGAAALSQPVPEAVAGLWQHTGKLCPGQPAGILEGCTAPHSTVEIPKKMYFEEGMSIFSGKAPWLCSLLPTLISSSSHLLKLYSRCLVGVFEHVQEKNMWDGFLLEYILVGLWQLFWWDSARTA